MQLAVLSVCNPVINHIIWNKSSYLKAKFAKDCALCYIVIGQRNIKGNKLKCRIK